MSSQPRIRDTVLLVLMLSAALGLALTRDSEKLESSPTPRIRYSLLRVDETPLQTARFIARLASTLEERQFAQEAVRLADLQLDLAFAEALRKAAELPPALSPEAHEISRLVSANSAQVKVDQDAIEKTTEQLKHAAPARRDILQGQLDLQQARLQLDQGRLDESKEDLIRSGGDPVSSLQRAFEEHKLSQQHGADITTAEAPTNSAAANYKATNLVAQLTALYALGGGKISLLRQARQEAMALAAELNQVHASLERQIAAMQAQPLQGTGAQKSEKPGASAEDLTLLRRQSADRTTLTELDKRIENQQELANTYGGWIGLVTGQQNRALRGVMRSALWILLIILAVHFGDRVLQRLLSYVSKRRAELGNISVIAHFAMQASGVLLVLAVFFGVPEQLPAAVFGVVGAGVTVASKDLTLAFIDSRVKGLIGTDAKQASVTG